MKRTNKLWLALLLTVLVAALLAAGLTAAAEEPAVIDQGTCGQNLTWVLTDDGTLTISGTGRMNDYSRNQVPWRSNRSLIQSVVIENGVRNIGSFTFEYSSNLTSVTMPNSIERIGSHAFATCVNLKNVEIPNGVTRIDYDAFASCGLLSVEIPDSVITIYDYAFADCRKMKTLILGSNLQTIELTAFVNCEALEDVVLPDSLLTLGSSAFTNCSSLTSFTVPAGVTNIKGNPVKLCKNLTSIEVAPRNPIYHSAGNCLIKTETGAIIFGCQTSVIPSDGSVTSINYGAFYGTQGLTRLKIPVSVTSIGAEAFGQCEFLQDVYYSGSEEQWNAMTIDEEGNAPLLNANIHFNVADWGYCGGEGDGTNLTWVLDNDGTLTINGSGYVRYGAFQGRTDMKNVVFLDGTDHIGANMFAGCSNLESITIPYTSMEEIEVTSVADCDSLSVICYNGTPAQWDLMAVYYNEEVFGGSYAEYAQTMRAYIKSLVQFADTDWGYCGGEGDGTNLMWELSTDYTLTISGTGEMANYTSYQNRTTAPWGPYYLRLKTVVLQPGVTSIGDSAFYDCTSLESVTIPDGVLSIGNHSFVGCFALTSVTIPDSVTSISNAFASCIALTSVMIPDSVTNIDAGAFSYCIALQDVYYGGSEAQWGEVQIDESGEYGNESLLNANIHYNVAAWGHYGEPVYILYKDGKLVLTGEGSTPMASPFPRTVNSVEIEDGVTYLATSAFGHQSTLTTAKLGSGLTGLEPLTFWDCTGLTSVTIPASITTIGERAFNGCTALTDIFYGGSEAQWNAMTIGAGNAPLLNAHIHYNATGHTPGETVIENNVPATCAEAGGYDEVVYCTQCPCECSRTHITVGELGHSWADPVHENEVAATCTEAGGYDEVIYCTKCPAEISRTHIDVPAPGHVWGEWVVVKQATTDEEGLMRRTCRNDPSHVEEQVIPKLQPQTTAFQQFVETIKAFFQNIIDWFSRLFRW